MAFSRKQAATAWIGMALIAGMLIYPPWFWDRAKPYLSSRQFGAGYKWIWSPPPAPSDAPIEDRWHPIIWWGRLTRQMLVVAVGMLLLLFLREARERSRPTGGRSTSPSN
jgi:hypothetical protein